MIAIRIIRDINNENNDDMVTIQKIGFSHFYVKYYDTGIPKVTFHANENAVVDHIHGIFDLLTMDEEPFESIQVDIPAYPSIIVKIRSLKQRRLSDSIVHIIRRTLHNWTQTCQNGSAVFSGTF